LSWIISVPLNKITVSTFRSNAESRTAKRDIFVLISQLALAKRHALLHALFEAMV
jgi:hypothetical protein